MTTQSQPQQPPASQNRFLESLRRTTNQLFGPAGAPTQTVQTRRNEPFKFDPTTAGLPVFDRGRFEQLTAGENQRQSAEQEWQSLIQNKPDQAAELIRQQSYQILKANGVDIGDPVLRRASFNRRQLSQGQQAAVEAAMQLQNFAQELQAEHTLDNSPAAVKAILGTLERYHRFVIRPAGVAVNVGVGSPRALLRGDFRDAFGRAAIGPAGRAANAVRAGLETPQGEQGIDFDVRIDQVTDALDLLPGQQGAAELFASFYLDPILPLGPLGKLERGAFRLATGGTRSAAGLKTIPGMEPPTVRPSVLDEDLLGMQPIEAGLSRWDEVENVARSAANRLRDKQSLLSQRDEFVQGAFRERDRLAGVIESQANRVASRSRSLAREAFEVNDFGQVTALRGIDPTLPAAPTVPDIAARFPRFRAFLTPKQKNAIWEMAEDVRPYRQNLADEGLEVGTRTDIMEGGFYLPRGSADNIARAEDLDQPIGASPRRGGRASAERSAVFSSMAEGIENGFIYEDIATVLGRFVRGVGNRAADRHIANAFRGLIDPETGVPLGRTAAERIDKGLRAQVMTLRAKIHTRLQTLVRQRARLGAQRQMQRDVGRLVEGTEGQREQVFDRMAPLTDEAGFPISQMEEVTDALTKMDGEIDALRKVLRRESRALSTAQRRALREQEHIEIRGETVDGLREELRSLKRRWERAKDRARQAPAGERFIDWPGLEGVSFPDNLAAAANEVIASRGPTRGARAAVLAVADATNNLYRGLRATLDNSAIGIQGLLGLASDQRAAGQALKVNLRAWGAGGDGAIGTFYRNFDDKALKQGRFSSRDWARFGLREGGEETEFMVGQGALARMGRLPGIRQANRAFGYFGDALRLEWADDLLLDELSMGRTLDDIINSGDAARIADIANNMTGWSGKKAFGSMGDLLFFAPRFLQSRLTTVTRAAMGLRPGASLDQRIARNSVLRMVGWGTHLTVAANEMLGQDTDFRPIVDGRWNPNFMRIRWGGRDWSLFGTWDSLARLIVATGSGDLSGFRGLSSGIVAQSWDLLSGEDFIGRKTRDDKGDLATHVFRSLTPFSFQETPELIEAFREGRPVEGIVGLVGELHGVKSSPLSARDLRDIITVESGFTDPVTDQVLTKYEQLNAVQRRQVNEDPRMEEFTSDRELELGDLREQMNDAFEDIRRTREKTENDLLTDGGTPITMSDKAFREAVSRVLQTRAIAGEAVFSNPDIQEHFAELETERQQLIDKWRNDYWSAHPPLDENSGRLMFEVMESERQGVLAEAKAAGLTDEEIETFITDRQRVFENDELQARFEQLERAWERLEGYWDIGRDAESFAGIYADEWSWYLQQDSSVQPFMRQNSEVLKTLWEAQRDARQAYRENNPDVDIDLVKYYGYRGATPQGEAWFSILYERIPVRKPTPSTTERETISFDDDGRVNIVTERG